MKNINKSDFIEGKNIIEPYRDDINKSELLNKQINDNFNTFFNTIDDMLFVLDIEGQIIVANTTVYNRLGYSDEELIGKSVLILHPENRREEAGEIVLDMLSGKKNFCPIPVLTKSGNEIPVETRIVLGEWNGNQALFGVVKDVSELKKSEEILSKAFQSNPAIMALTDLNSHKYIDANEAFVNKIGYSREEIIGRTASELGLFYNGSQRDEAKNLLLTKGRFANLEVDVRAKDGRILTGLFSGELIKTENSTQLLTVMIDVTDFKRAENYLKQTSERLELATRAGGVGIWDYDIVNNNLFWDDYMFKLYGVEKKDFNNVYKNWRDGLHPDDIERCDLEVQMAIKGEKDFDTEFRICWPDGTTRNIRALAIVKKDESGQPLHIIGTNWDITNSKKIEDALAESEENHRLLITQMEQGLAVHEIILDEEGKAIDYRFLDVNDSFERLTGLSRKDIIGKTVLEILPETEKYWIEKYGQVAMTGESIVYENYSKELGKFFEVIAYSPQPNKFAVIISDITERKLKDEEIIYRSSHDILTGLYNRRKFEDVLDLVEESGELPVSIIVGDVNSLKLINDAYGHISGDIILKKIAEIIKEVCGDNAYCARRGGDEFAIILPKTTYEEACAKVTKIKKRCDEESKDELMLNITFGVGIKTEEEQTLEQCQHVAEERMYTAKLLEGKNIRSTIVENLRMVLEEKTGETRNHCTRMSEMSQIIGEQMGFQAFEIANLKLLSLLHDIGKTAIPESILLKPDKLDEDEFSIMQKHCEIGYRIANTMPELVPIAEGILCHHERWDGSGYPQGLVGANIPIMSRIVAVLDTYDAMTNDRPYRKALSTEEAIEEITRCSGTQFDPEVVHVFLNNCVL